MFINDVSRMCRFWCGADWEKRGCIILFSVAPGLCVVSVLVTVNSNYVCCSSLGIDEYWFDRVLLFCDSFVHFFPGHGFVFPSIVEAWCVFGGVTVDVVAVGEEEFVNDWVIVNSTESLLDVVFCHEIVQAVYFRFVADLD